MSEYHQPPLCDEMINGINLRLGAMTCAQLLQLEADCRERMVEAQTDLMIVQDQRMRMFPEGEP